MSLAPYWRAPAGGQAASAAGRGAQPRAAPWERAASGARQQTAGLRSDLAVVLVRPTIPPNVGSVARTCAATRVPLHLVGPLGFSLEDKKLKRAGLDYWDSVCVLVHDDWRAFERWAVRERSVGAPGGARVVAFSKFGARPHTEPGAYRKGDLLLFGAEQAGLPEEAHALAKATGGVRLIPIDQTHVRSLNLAVSVGMGTFEALRQLDAAPPP